jgi:hypothetical protein
MRKLALMPGGGGRPRSSSDDRRVHGASLPDTIRSVVGASNMNAAPLSKLLIMNTFFASKVECAPSSRELHQRYFRSVQEPSRDIRRDAPNQIRRRS